MKALTTAAAVLMAVACTACVPRSYFRADDVVVAAIPDTAVPIVEIVHGGGDKPPILVAVVNHDNSTCQSTTIDVSYNETTVTVTAAIDQTTSIPASCDAAGRMYLPFQLDEPIGARQLVAVHTG